MKRPVITILAIMTAFLTACTTTAPLQPEEEAAAGSCPDKDDAIIFWTKDAGTASIEELGGLYYLTVPRTETFLAPLEVFESPGGEPIFFSAEEGVTVKVYLDALLWMHWGKAEYVPWIFTENPNRFYFTF